VLAQACGELLPCSVERGRRFFFAGTILGSPTGFGVGYGCGRAGGSVMSLAGLIIVAAPVYLVLRLTPWHLVRIAAIYLMVKASL
jgi:hypothetical protein